MENPFENLMTNPKEKLPIKEPVAGEPDVEASEKDTKKNPETEKMKELLELTSLAKVKARSIIDSAFNIRNRKVLKPEERKANWDEGKRVERKAYRIYAALMMIEAELSQSIITTTKKLLEGEEIDGFYNEKEAEDFLRRVVGNTEDVTENDKEDVAMVA